MKRMLLFFGFVISSASICRAESLAIFEFEGVFSRYSPSNTEFEPIPFEGRLVYSLDAPESSLVIPVEFPRTDIESTHYAYNKIATNLDQLLLEVTFGGHSLQFGPYANGFIGVLNGIASENPMDEFRVGFSSLSYISEESFAPEGWMVGVQFELMRGMAFDGLELPRTLDVSQFEQASFIVHAGALYCFRLNNCPYISYSGEITEIRAVPEPSSFAIVGVTVTVLVGARHCRRRIVGKRNDVPKAPDDAGLLRRPQFELRLVLGAIGRRRVDARQLQRRPSIAKSGNDRGRPLDLSVGPA
jgi:hypothetical protein